MRTLPLRQAKATLSAVVEAAERGEATTITKHGRPVAMVTPLPGAEAPVKRRNEGLVELLMSIPEGLDLSREPWPAKDVKL